LLFLANGARADDTQAAAREKFRQATEAHERGDYRAAAELFEEAHRLAPAAGAKFNAGIAWDESGNSPHAADDYETALEMGGLTEDEAKQAEERLGALRKVLGYLSVDEPAGATAEVEGIKALVPFRTHLAPGSHRILGTRGAATTTFEVDIHAGEVKHVVLDLPAKPEAPPNEVAPPPLQPDSERLAKERPQAASSSAQTTWGLVALGAGVVFSGVAVVLGVQTLKARDAWDASGHHDMSKHDDAVQLRTFTNVAWGGAFVAGATGTVLLLSSPTIRF
jgi:tetratricopeptide (TPR) repeat protein